MARRKSVCVDLDATLAQYDHWKGIEHIGDPIPGAKEFMEALAAEDVDVIIFTTRTNKDVNRDIPGNLLAVHVADWCHKHNIPFASVYSGSGKPLCDVFVDDRAVTCRPQEDPNAYDTALSQVKDFLK